MKQPNDDSGIAHSCSYLETDYEKGRRWGILRATHIQPADLSIMELYNPISGLSVLWQRLCFAAGSVSTVLKLYSAHTNYLFGTQNQDEAA